MLAICNSWQVPLSQFPILIPKTVISDTVNTVCQGSTFGRGVNAFCWNIHTYIYIYNIFIIIKMYVWISSSAKHIIKIFVRISSIELWYKNKTKHCHVRIKILWWRFESISLTFLLGSTYMFNFSQVRVCTSLCSILKAEIFWVI